MDIQDIQYTAEKAVGNWKKFDSFGWYDQPDNAENWMIYHYVNRDSGLLEQSNAREIERRFSRFVQYGINARFDHFGHWAYGWVDALVIRVYDNRGRITKAFKRFCELLDNLEEYPILDDFDYSNAEYTAAISGIVDSANWECDIEITEDQAGSVFSWFWEHDQAAVENVDDSGAYPTENQMRTALTALGIEEEIA